MPSPDSRKVVLVGTGMVGMSYAYALLNQNACDKLVLIDINHKRAIGEAMDLNHGLAFSGSHMKIYAGDYTDCKDADIVAICAGVAQKPGETRLDLLSRNAEVFSSIIEPVLSSGFHGIFLVATNPVDIMTHITHSLRVSCLPRHWYRNRTGHCPAALFAWGLFSSGPPQHARLRCRGTWGQ